MNSLVLKNIGRFIFLWLLQIIILNYVQLPYGMQLYIYILFILLLPHQTPNWLLLLLAFFSGLSVDIFTGMLGLQAAAATFMAFLRIYIYNQNASIYDTAPVGTPKASRMGWGNFMLQTSILILVFYTILFFLEIFSFSNILQTLWLILSSSALCIISMLLCQLLFTKGETKK
ncbi:MAG: hypothetical protein RRY15_03925 [Bacteroidales bacterium]